VQATHLPLQLIIKILWRAFLISGGHLPSLAVAKSEGGGSLSIRVIRAFRG
jgi:hypothetical protein